MGREFELYCIISDALEKGQNFVSYELFIEWLSMSERNYPYKGHEFDMKILRAYAERFGVDFYGMVDVMYPKAKFSDEIKKYAKNPCGYKKIEGRSFKKAWNFVELEIDGMKVLFVEDDLVGL